MGSGEYNNLWYFIIQDNETEKEIYTPDKPELLTQNDQTDDMKKIEEGGHMENLKREMIEYSIECERIIESKNSEINELKSHIKCLQEELMQHEQTRDDKLDSTRQNELRTAVLVLADELTELRKQVRTS